MKKYLGIEQLEERTLLTGSTEVPAPDAPNDQEHVCDEIAHVAPMSPEGDHDHVICPKARDAVFATFDEGSSDEETGIVGQRDSIDSRAILLGQNDASIHDPAPPLQSTPRPNSYRIPDQWIPLQSKGSMQEHGLNPRLVPDLERLLEDPEFEKGGGGNTEDLKEKSSETEGSDVRATNEGKEPRESESQSNDDANDADTLEKANEADVVPAEKKADSKGNNALKSILTILGISSAVTASAPLLKKLWNRQR